MTCAAMRKLALALPEAEERAHHGHPDFRVRGKVFATLWPDERRAVVRLGRLGSLARRRPETARRYQEDEMTASYPDTRNS